MAKDVALLYQQMAGAFEFVEQNEVVKPKKIAIDFIRIGESRSCCVYILLINKVGLTSGFFQLSMALLEEDPIIFFNSFRVI